LYGIALLDGHGHDAGPIAPNTAVVGVRDLAAVVSDSEYEPVQADGGEIARYREVVEAVFARHAVLPAPLGVVFRNRDTLVRWLELHYHTFADALAFVDERSVARVQIARRSAPIAGDAEDLTALAAESLRTLRRGAVAVVPLRADSRDERLVMSASFLVDRDRWGGFKELVSAEQQRHPLLTYEQTGPWPPFDFVRMQFGG
jgi:gas vesicle protein GvpL/GvpF